MDEETTRRNIAHQVELYGASVGEFVGTIRDRLGLSQRRLASVIGLSPPMLSQLVTGQRVKIGNPAVVARLTALLELAESDPVPSGANLERRLDQIHTETRKLSSADRPRSAATDALRSAVSRQELRDAAAMLESRFPELAGLLREAADE